jgi:ubiquinone/menaquinone biosynthesis C-methylase UbiE
VTEDHDAVVRRSFERQVGIFSGPDSIFAKRTGSFAWIEPLDPEMIVLDVACGAAHASESIAPLVRQVVGLDITAALLELGAQRLRDVGIDNVLLQEGNATSMPFADESFDIVFCRAALHHFDDPQRVIAEMARVCRAGGRLVLMDLIEPSPEVRDEFDEIHRLIDPSHVRAFVEAELPELLPGGIDALVYAETFAFRFPVEGTFTEQSERAAVLERLHADARGNGPPTGFDPVEEDGKLVVSFEMCTLQAART